MERYYNKNLLDFTFCIFRQKLSTEFRVTFILAYESVTHTLELLQSVVTSLIICSSGNFPRSMSPFLYPVRLCQNPIRTLFLPGRFGSQFNRVLPRSTRVVTRVRMSHSTSSNPSMNSEKEAALAAASTPPDSPTIFDKIISKEIPANVVYEDEKVLAFRDINPQAPVHILIIPKVKDGLSRLAKAEERHFEILGRLLHTAKVIAKQEGLEDGFRIVINDGPKGCQSVYHIHVHLLGGRQMEWPAG